MNRMLDKLTPGLHGKLTLLCDLILVVLALLLATDFQLTFDAAGTSVMGAAVVAWLFGTASLRLYNPYTPRSKLDNVALALVAAVVMTAGLTGMWLLLYGSLSSFHLLTFGATLALGLALTQTIVWRPLQKNAAPSTDVLIVGTDPLGVATYERLISRENGTPVRVVGFLQCDDDSALPRMVRAPVLGKATDLLKVLEEHTVDEVYLAKRVLNHGLLIQRLVKSLEEIGVPFAVPLHSLRYNRATLLEGGTPDGYLHYLNTKPKPFQWALKRIVDIVCSTAALVVLSPLLLVVSLVIKFQDGGPILYTQSRVGLHGAEFRFLKFRSMVQNADALKDKLIQDQQNERTGPAFKMKNDPRVTAFGRFIRKYSIDELPQLLNILRGDMTIVGPRPPLPREVAQYKTWQRRRLSVRPGLTCYWQVGGRDEIGFDEWMDLDLRYVDHWSLKRDVALILATVPVVLFGKGAS